MKHILLFSILFCAIALPALGELTPQDLDKIRLIVNEEIQKESSIINQKIDRLDTRIQNVAQNISWVRGKFDGVEKHISHTTNITYGLIALIVAAIGIPAWVGKKDRDQERKIQDLTAEIEMLKQIVTPDKRHQ